MIGVFDSGFGGLSVCREIIKKLPGNDIVFFADIANYPYGNKSKDEVRDFNTNAINFLIEKGAEAIVVGCNTASSLLTDEYKKSFDLPIFDVISSGVKQVDPSAMDHIGLIATQGTIDNGLLEEKIADRGVRVTSKAAPDLVHLAQRMVKGREAREIVSSSLKPFKDIDIDGFYLGCTHYSLIQEEIYDYLHLPIIDPAIQTAEDLKEVFSPQSKITKLYFHSSSHRDEDRDSVKKVLNSYRVEVI